LSADANNELRDLIRLGDLEKASQVADDGLSACDEGDCTPHAWSLRLAWADLLRLRGRVDEAPKYLAKFESSTPPLNSDVPSAAGLRKSRGYCLGLLGQYIPCHALLVEAERMAEAAELLELHCEILQCQAMILYLQQEYESSERVFRTILEKSESVGGWYFRANGFWGMGKTLMIRNRYHEAMPWLKSSLSIFELAGARTSMAIVWSELAVCHLGLGDDEKSLELLENALAVQEEAGRAQNYLVALANIGNVYLHRKDYLRAIDYYRKALALAREIKDPVSIQKWSYNIRLAYARLKQSVDGISPHTS
jgi:tetratricopeptide (TPR) repeat protein